MQTSVCRIVAINVRYINSDGPRLTTQQVAKVVVHLVQTGDRFQGKNGRISDESFGYSPRIDK